MQLIKTIVPDAAKSYWNDKNKPKITEIKETNTETKSVFLKLKFYLRA
mgnify:CR=1 FL=1